MKLTWLLVLCLIVSAALAKVDVDDSDDEYETIDVIQEGGQPERLLNPCNRHQCKRGEICVLDEGKAKCECITCEIPKPDDNIVKVCSTKNITYESECFLDREHCLCRNNLPGCTDNREKRIRLDYFTACKELTECPENEFEMFASRMKDWLFRVMNDLTMRGYEEMNDYRTMLEEARADENKVGAVLWKFCDLDVHPTDRHVSRRELMYIIASLKPMEHCLVPFLNSCDADDDNTINLVEWGTCLNLDHAVITDKCKKSKKNAE
ncbi:hypothetical protein ACF0H5_001666 [Mactra antiquata]